MDGQTTGAPLALLIENRDHAKWRGKADQAFTTPRPGHADLTGAIKYGYRDLRPALERASARETAARVAVGAVCKHLAGAVWHPGGRLCGRDRRGRAPTWARCLTSSASPWLKQSDVRCPDPVAAEAMHERIRQIMQERDTLGGVIEVVVLGLPPGLGSYVQWDRRLEARLGAALLSVQAIKGRGDRPGFAQRPLARHPGP